MIYKINNFNFLTVTGKSSISMAIVIPFAIREAFAAARLESEIPTTSWFDIGKNAFV